jgi:glycosyltransferase involved in cell wall biosynthesis
MIKNKNIVFIHSLNNFSGSPNVLSLVIRGFVARGYQTELITSRGEGFLSGLKGVQIRYTCYRWSDNKALTAFYLLLSQLQTFFMVLFMSKTDNLFYINTIVPVGAVWACYLTGKRIVYHVHENMQQPKLGYRIFRWTYKRCNRKNIFVSHYLKSTALNCRDAVVVYNALHSDFVSEAQEDLLLNKNERRDILMVASPRRFKGIFEFAELARILPQFSFELVLSATEAEVSAFTNEAKVPANLIVYPVQSDMHPFYRRAKLILQLSHPEAWIETFGLTILEAMYYGIPAIVPNVGGPKELVTDGKNGYLVNPHNLKEIISKIEKLMPDEQIYAAFSENALAKSKQFSEEKMIDEIERYLLK